MGGFRAEMRLKEVELVDRKRPRAKKAVLGAIEFRLLLRRAIEIGERHMRREPSLLLKESRAPQRRVDFGLQMRERRRRNGARPQRARLAVAEIAAARKLQVECRRSDAGQRRSRFLKAMPIGFSNKGERQMEIVVRYPARAPKAGLKIAERVDDRRRRRDGDEEPMHREAPDRLATTIFAREPFRKLELRRRQGQRRAEIDRSSEMREQRTLFLGYGFVARALARRLGARGWRMAGTHRRADQAPFLAAEAVEPAAWTAQGVASAAFDGVDAVLVSTPPDERGCPALAAAGEALSKASRTWIGYLSTNGVYGDYGGAVVDERSALRATSSRGRARIAAEDSWRSFAEEHGHRLVIFRLPGIYGPGRSAFDQIREGRAQRIFKPGQVFSRMHVDDIADAIAASIDRPNSGALFNLADDEPAPPQDVIEYACRLLGVEPPPLVPFEEARLSEMARSFYADNKRVSNSLMKDALGVSLAYPTYREGLKAILAGGG